MRPRLPVLWMLLCLTLSVPAEAAVFSARVHWAPSPTAGVTGYRVYTRAVGGVWGAPIDAGLPTPAGDGTLSAIVTNLDVTVAYGFAVAAYNTGGIESATSNEITLAALVTTTTTATTSTTTTTTSATSTTTTRPPIPLSSPWLHQDIGSVGLPGTAGLAGATFTIAASGADIWDTADAFHFVYQPLTGNGEITARVGSVQNTDLWAKAGVMIRETLAAGSRHALVVVTPGHGTDFERRIATGGVTTHTFGPVVAAPYWVRLVRQGNSFSAYASANGTAWTLIGSDTIAMAASVYVGLPVTAHNNAVLTTATLDGVAVSGGVAPTTTTTTRPPTTTTTIAGSTTTTIVGVTTTTTLPAECAVDDDCPASDACHMVHCRTGACVTEAVECPDDGSCRPGVCDPAQGCGIQQRPDGSACDAGDPCVSGACSSGVCVLEQTAGPSRARDSHFLSVNRFVLRSAGRSRRMVTGASFSLTDAVDPTASGGTIELRSATGVVLYRATLPAGAFHANKRRTTFKLIPKVARTVSGGVTKLLLRSDGHIADVVASGITPDLELAAAQRVLTLGLRFGEACVRAPDLSCSQNPNVTTCR